MSDTSGDFRVWLVHGLRSPPPTPQSFHVCKRKMSMVASDGPALMVMMKMCGRAACPCGVASQITKTHVLPNVPQFP